MHSEIQAVRETVARLNLELSAGGAKVFELVEWDGADNGVPPLTTRTPDGGQAVINTVLKGCQVYLGIMGDYYGKGTAEEYHEAVAACQRFGKPEEILFYFKDCPPADSAEYHKVIGFREHIWKSGGITQKFADAASLAAQLGRHLTEVLKSLRDTTYLLTSESPRRIAVLRQLGICKDRQLFTFQVSTSPVKGPYSLEDAKAAAEQTAREKLKEAIKDNVIENHIQCRVDSTIMIGADTLVWCNGEVLDTPALFPRNIETRSASEYLDRAREMLRKQRGREVVVLTGLAVVRASHPRQVVSVVVETRARIRNVSDEMIEAYLKNEDAMWRAGALSLDGQGVAFFEGVNGSFSNVVGLPIRDFSHLIRRLPGYEMQRFFPLVEASSPARAPAPGLSVLAVGDINFDLVCNQIEAGALQAIQVPGRKLVGKIRRRAGGTAVNLAIAAQRAGFASAKVVGVIGDDALGDFVSRELRKLEIESLVNPVAGAQTSVAIVLREDVHPNAQRKDLSLTLTDARQAIDRDVPSKKGYEITNSDAVHVSGYAITDLHRCEVARDILIRAHAAGALTVLDVVVDMDRRWAGITEKEEFFSHMGGFEGFLRWLKQNPRRRLPVDMIVAETREMMRWIYNETSDGGGADWHEVTTKLVPRLLAEFEVVVLRDAEYSRELVATRERTGLPEVLDYQMLPSEKRFGYGDSRTARLVYDLLAPRIILASKSPQRLELLKQIAHPDKILVEAPRVDEAYQENERAEDRVSRLARAKAEAVLAKLLDGGILPEVKFRNSADRMDVLGEDGAACDRESKIEVIVAADTEAVINLDGREQVLEQPSTDEEARQILRKLSGKTHRMLTGMCVIGVNRETGGRVQKILCESTEIEFDELSEVDIDAYVASGEPRNRAGAYAIQGFAEVFIRRIHGSYSNVVGLPLERLCSVLEQDLAMPVWSLNKVSGWRTAKPLMKNP